MPRPFPILTNADKEAFVSGEFSATFRYIGTRPPIQDTGKYRIICMGYDGNKHEIEHGEGEDFIVTDPRVARCLELHSDYFTKELDYQRIS